MPIARYSATQQSVERETSSDTAYVLRFTRCPRLQKQMEFRMFDKILKTAFIVSVTAFILICVAAAQAQDLEAGLVGYWTFDAADTNGNTVKNFVGDNHGTINGAKKVEGKIGDALEFDGATNFVKMERPEPMPESLTIMAWAEAESWSPGGRRNAIDSITGGMWYRLGFQPSGGNFEFVCDTGDEVGGREQTVADLGALEGWHHLAGVRDFDKKVLIFYVDGVETARLDFQHEQPIIPEALVVGAGHRGTIEFWQGRIDEVAIFNIALTEDDVKNFMDNGLAALAVSPSGKLASMWGNIKVQ